MTLGWLVWALGGCGDGAPDSEPLTPEAWVEFAAARGPHGVGYRWDTYAYADPAGSERDIGVAVWYPTAAVTGVPARYFRGTIEADGVWADAAPEAGPFPVVVYSHGHQAFPEIASYLVEHLASHGAIVIAPEHAGDTTLDDPDRPTELYFQRPADVSAALDGLDAADLPVDSSAPILAIGHSFGGYTVHALSGAVYDAAVIEGCATPTEDGFCSSMNATYAELFTAGFRDERVAAALTMAPGSFDLFGASGLSAIDLPLMVMGGTLDAAGDASPAGNAVIAKPSNRYLRIQGFSHNSFTDLPSLDGTVEGRMDPEQGHRLIRVYALSWWRHVLGEAGAEAVVDGAVQVDPAVEVLGGTSGP